VANMFRNIISKYSCMMSERSVGEFETRMNRRTLESDVRGARSTVGLDFE